MKAYKFITTFSNVQDKFDIIAYPKELNTFITKVKQSTIYNEVKSFGNNEQPIKYKIFYFEGFKFFSKIIFLGYQGTKDNRGGNYIATTIAIDENIYFNPAHLFNDAELWKDNITVEEDHFFARKPFLPAFNIELKDSKYIFLTRHLGKIRYYSTGLLKLIQLLFGNRGRDLLLNSNREEYSILFFLMTDILPDTFTENITITLHSNDPDRETANLVETIQYNEDKINHYKKRYTIFENYHSRIEEADFEEKYLKFLQKILAETAPNIDKIKVFNEIYGYLLFNSHDMESLNSTAEVIKGQVNFLFSRYIKNPEIDLVSIGLLLVKNSISTLKGFLEEIIESVFPLEENILENYMNFANNFKGQHDFSLLNVIKIYEKKRKISIFEFRQIILNFCEDPILDVEAVRYLLDNMSQLMTPDTSKEYEEALRLLHEFRKELFDDPYLSKLWNIYEINEKYLTSDNPVSILFFFENRLVNFEKMDEPNKKILFDLLKSGLKKPWRVEHLELGIKSLYKKITLKSQICAFICEFLEYINREEDRHFPRANFILCNIISYIANKDDDLLCALCIQLENTAFKSTLHSEIIDRFLDKDVKRLLISK